MIRAPDPVSEEPTILRVTWLASQVKEDFSPLHPDFIIGCLQYNQDSK